MNKIICGDALTELRKLPDELVQCVVTSPPYWSLRDYGVEGIVWDSGKDCDHNFNIKKYSKVTNYNEGFNQRWENSPNRIQKQSEMGKIKNIREGFCNKCGAWYGSFGLEPTPELYVKHMVEIFREVKRVLRKDGTVWLNLGDSYWGGKGQSAQAWSTENTDRDTLQKPYHQISGTKETRPQDGKHETIKPKDLVGIPWRVAFALQKDGWYLRSDIIWSKPNPMPESVTDRPTKAHEYIFLLSKNAKYYYDQEAILEDISPNTHNRISQDLINQIGSHRAHAGNKSTPMKAVIRTPKQTAPGTGIKNNDSFNNATCLPVSKRNKRSVWEVTTQPFPEAHFATFPENLIKPCILAGCPERGIVLDPFMGSGTSALVARNLNRQYIGIELNPDYIKIIEKRLQQQRAAI